MEKAEANRITNWLKKEEPEILSFLKTLVLMESPTSDPLAQKVLLNHLKKTLEKLDFASEIFPGTRTGGFLISRPENRVKHVPVQLMVGHCDTVWPVNTLKSMPLVQENGMIKGPGIYDMKAGITQMIFALRAIEALGFEPALTPVVIINSDEEKGSRESTRAIRRLAKIAKRAYILEPPLGLKGKLKTARKGLGRFTLTVKGKPAHAGLEPEKGASAILELSHQVQQLFQLNDPEKGITVNVGMIQGGTTPNVIAPEASAVIDVRVLSSEDGEKITQSIKNLKPVIPDTKLIIEGTIGRMPMEKTKRNQQLWLSAKKAGKKLGLNLEEATAGGGSDGNTTSLYTATLDGLGTTGDGAHAHHEFIFTEKLLERTALLTLLLLMD